MTLAFSSSSSVSKSWPMPCSSDSVACASSSSTFESAKPTWIRTQSPTSAVVEEADVHRAPYTGDIDHREAIALVDDLQDAAGYGKAHRAVPPRVDPRRYRAVYRAVVRLATNWPAWSTGI